MSKICIPVVETTVEKMLKAIKKANRLADLIELRLDYLRKLDLDRLFNEAERPFIVTNRRKEEGGKYKGDNERKRLSPLMKAIEWGADYIDVEIRSNRSLVKCLVRNKGRTKIILSFHDLHKTPPLKELQTLFDSMIQMRADIVKIVTFAKSWGDNLQVLSLIPYAEKKKREIITFCMGERGKMSRIFAPLMGAVWTYAALTKNRPSAPGQLTVYEMRDIWKRLK